MKGGDSVEGLIDAIRANAPPYGQTSTTNPLLLRGYLDYITKRMESTLKSIRGEHYAIIGVALARVGLKLEGTRKYRRTMHVLLRMGTTESRAALAALCQYMALCRMRCTYRIGLSRQIVYTE